LGRNIADGDAVAAIALAVTIIVGATILVRAAAAAVMKESDDKGRK
jgi:hypothetical protein